jgi:DNA repair exonuclease SbcCD nuclease subunit
MKIAILSDTHWSVKKGSKHFHDYFELFYKNIFFPTLEERGIKTVIHMGDAFDNRKGIDFWGLDWTRRVVLEPLRKYEVHMLVGNHDIFFRNSTIINAPELLLNDYQNIKIYSSPKEFCIDGLDTLMLPWICTDNRGETDELLKNTKAKVVFGHLELAGFAAYPGYIQVEGMDASVFKKFDRVYSGHYHTKSDDGRIHYLGNPYQMFWNDVDDVRGFHIFDTDTYELEHFKNPYNMFERIYYEDTDYKKFNTSYLEEKIVKVVVRQKSDQLKFDKFIDKILKANFSQNDKLMNFQHHNYR